MSEIGIIIFPSSQLWCFGEYKKQIRLLVEEPMRTSAWTILLQGVINHQGHPASKHHHYHQRSSKVTVNGDTLHFAHTQIKNMSKWVTEHADSHKAPRIFCFSCLLAWRERGCNSLPNISLSDTDGNGLGILWPHQVNSPSGRLLPWIC